MKNMPLLTINYASLLIILGLGMYFYSGQQSVTALIPAFFALPVMLCGFLARNEKYLKLAMHLAATLGLIGIFATIKGLTKLPLLLQGEELERPLAVISQSAMCVMSVAFVGLCVGSFIAIRRERKRVAAGA